MEDGTNSQHPTPPGQVIQTYKQTKCQPDPAGKPAPRANRYLPGIQLITPGARRTTVRCTPAPSSNLLELGFIELVFRDLGGDAAPRQAADLGALADVAARLFQCLAQVLLLDAADRLGQE